jgi:hypothetical protein
MSCATCGYWKKISDQHGKCRRDVPRAELIPMQGIGGQGLSVVTFWPETKPDDVCGWHSKARIGNEFDNVPSTILQS